MHLGLPPGKSQIYGPRAERRLLKASSGGKVACMIMQGARLPTNRQEECLPGIGARAHTDDVNIML